MPLTVEDGTGVVGANSYVTLQEADDYMTDHPYYSANWADLSDSKKNSLLIYAVTLMDSLFEWAGCRVYNEQELGWPRQNVYSREYVLLDHLTVLSRVKKAQIEIAVALSRGDAFEESSSFGLEELEIDVIKLKFDKKDFKDPLPVQALVYLRDLGRYIVGPRVIRAEPS